MGLFKARATVGLSSKSSSRTKETRLVLGVSKGTSVSVSEPLINFLSKEANVATDDLILGFTLNYNIGATKEAIEEAMPDAVDALTEAGLFQTGAEIKAGFDAKFSNYEHRSSTEVEDFIDEEEYLVGYAAYVKDINATISDDEMEDFDQPEAHYKHLNIKTKDGEPIAVGNYALGRVTDGTVSSTIARDLFGDGGQLFNEANCITQANDKKNAHYKRFTYQLVKEATGILDITIEINGEDVEFPLYLFKQVSTTVTKTIVRKPKDEVAQEDAE